MIIFMGRKPDSRAHGLRVVKSGSPHQRIVSSPKIVVPLAMSKKREA